MSNLIGIPQLAAELGVNQSTIFRRIKRGKLVPVGYIGKQAVFYASDVERIRRGEQPLPERAKQ